MIRSKKFEKNRKAPNNVEKPKAISKFENKIQNAEKLIKEK